MKVPPLILQTFTDSPFLAADVTARDALPQSNTSERLWHTQFRAEGWGPDATTYPRVSLPLDSDSVQWQCEHIVATARRYLGLAYRHHHIPAWDPLHIGMGLDCSNFTAWVYNFGLGIKFTSNTLLQADGEYAPGRKLNESEPRHPGDLVFLYCQDRSRISHVAIYLNETTVIDAHDGKGSDTGILIREIKGWYASHQVFTRRIIE